MSHPVEKTTTQPISVTAEFSLQIKNEHFVHTYTYNALNSESTDTIEETNTHLVITEKESSKETATPTNASPSPLTSTSTDGVLSAESTQLLELVSLIEKAKFESNQYLTQMIGEYGQGAKVDNTEEGEVEEEGDEEMENGSKGGSKFDSSKPSKESKKSKKKQMKEEEKS